MIFDTTGDYSKTAWDASLKPAQDESFDEWWKRAGETLSHLHQKIAEQWIYRHWERTPYKNVPIKELLWRQETWATERVLSEVFIREEYGSLDPAFDYGVFHGRNREPGRTMDKTGTWDYPIVVLETPDGVKKMSGVDRTIRYCLIEGHQRFRYLNALYSRNECATEHSLFTLTLKEHSSLG
jgi:hypothetical protein